MESRHRNLPKLSECPLAYISWQTLHFRIHTLFLANRTFIIPGHLWGFFEAFAANSAHPSLIHTWKEKGRNFRFMPTGVLKPECGTGTQYHYSITALRPQERTSTNLFFMINRTKQSSIYCKKCVQFNIRDNWDASQVLLGHIRTAARNLCKVGDSNLNIIGHGQ